MAGTLGGTGSLGDEVDDVEVLGKLNTGNDGLCEDIEVDEDAGDGFVVVVVVVLDGVVVEEEEVLQYKTRIKIIS